MSIHSIILRPRETIEPRQALEVAAVGDTVYLAMHQYDEDYKGTRMRVIEGEPLSPEHEDDIAHRAQIALSMEELVEALQTLARSELRASGIVTRTHTELGVPQDLGYNDYEVSLPDELRDSLDAALAGIAS